MCGPTRLNVVSTHSATSSKMRGMSGAFLALRLQHKEKLIFDGIPMVSVLFHSPCPTPEIQAVQFGAARELGAPPAGAN